jgi:hypothetical protein
MSTHGHNHAQQFRVWITGQVRRVTAPIRREDAPPAVVEPDEAASMIVPDNGQYVLRPSASRGCGSTSAPCREDFFVDLAAPRS